MYTLDNIHWSKHYLDKQFIKGKKKKLEIEAYNFPVSLILKKKKKKNFLFLSIRKKNFSVPYWNHDHLSCSPNLRIPILNKRNYTHETKTNPKQMGIKLLTI